MQFQEQNEALIDQIRRLQAEGRDALAMADAAIHTKQELERLQTNLGELDEALESARLENQNLKETFVAETNRLQEESNSYQARVSRLQKDLDVITQVKICPRNPTSLSSHIVF